MRLGKTVSLLLAGFLTLSSLNVLAATTDTKTKSNISTKKKQTTSSKVTKKATKQQHKNTTKKYFQTGIASYYANMFNGRLTANGEIFSNAKMTAAHRTLPFGTVIEVTNLRNGRSVVVRINDRGPYVHPRVLDLSSAAAKKIGMLHSGLAKVRIDILNDNAKAKAGSTKKR